MSFFELRQASRSLLRQPGFTTSAILLIALGVGAGTAVFTLVNALLLTTPPLIVQPQRVVRLNAARPGDIGASTFPDYSFYRDGARAFSHLFAYDPFPYTVQMRAVDHLDEADLRFVSGNFFGALGIRPVAGRLLNAQDDHEQADNLMVVSEAFSRRFFESPTAAVGRVILVSGYSFTVVGVVPAAFKGAARDDAPVDLWLPLWKRVLVNNRPRMDMERTPQYIHAFLNVMGRLRTGLTKALAQAELDGLAARLTQTYPEATGIQVSLSEHFGLGSGQRAVTITLVRLITGLALVVLLMVCANLGNLMLARALARRSELIVKLALGARRVRLIGQIGIETLLLAAGGAALGLLAARWAARALVAVLPFDVAQPAPDQRVYACALALATLTALVCGSAPALFASRVSAVHNASARTVGGGATARSILVVVQVGLCFVLLAGAALFARTLGRVLATPLGYDPANVLIVQLNLQPHGYNDTTGTVFYERALERVRALPGVRSAALGSVMPLRGGRRSSSIEIEGWPVREDQPLRIHNNVIGPGYLQTLRMTLRTGRDFRDDDRGNTLRVALINESMAARYWPNQNPLGKRFRGGRSSEWMEVIGVVTDTRPFAVTEAPVPMFYRVFAQAYFPRMQLYLHTTASPMNLAGAVRRAILELDPNVVVRGIDPFEQIYRTSIRSYAANARLVGVLGAIALVLAALGLYAVTSYLVLQRTREFGLRLAVGAQPRDLLRAVLAEAARRTAFGITIGVMVSISTLSLVERFLFELSPLDPMTLGIAGLLLGAGALLASWLPARRAMRVEPLRALRAD